MAILLTRTRSRLPLSFLSDCDMIKLFFHTRKGEKFKTFFCKELRGG